MKDAQAYIERLQLLPHPEGGFYREMYRSEGIINNPDDQMEGERNFSTAIYYLLQQSDFSAFHRIKSDECWHFYAGGPLLIHMLDDVRGYSVIKLGNNIDNGEVFQYVVKAGTWFACQPAPQVAFCLAGCTVAPGFDFADFEMAEKERLLQQFTQHSVLIEQFCR